MALTRTCFYPRRAPFQRHLPLLGEAPVPSFTQISSDDSPCFAVTRERPDALAFRRSLALRTQLWLRSHVLSERDTCRPTSSGAAAVSDGKPARHLARWHPAGNALSLWLPVRCFFLVSLKGFVRMPQRGFLWIYPVSDLFSFLNLQVLLLPSPGGFQQSFLQMLLRCHSLFSPWDPMI